jgi:dUTP pyrophosphatase
VRRLSPAATLPARSYDGDAGLDLNAAEAALIGPGERASVGTGLAIEVPAGHAALVLPRSGLAARHGIALVNAPGLIDSGYRGELRVLLLNTDRSAAFEVEPGERIAQLVLVRVEATEPVEVEELAVSERAERGFGSSGR